MDDPIFDLEKPNSNVQSEEIECRCCAYKFGLRDTGTSGLMKLDVNFGLKYKIFCDFCGHKVCERCLYKVRLF